MAETIGKYILTVNYTNKVLFQGIAFYFLRSIRQLSAKCSEARQSWRSRKGKSCPKENFLPTRFQFSLSNPGGHIFSL